MAALNALGYQLREDPQATLWAELDPWTKTVWVPRNHARLAAWGTSAASRTFALAHELGHLRLHLRVMARGAELSAKHELEADQWAVEWLMPKAMLMERPEWLFSLAGALDPIPLLAQTFEVPLLTMELRLQQLSFERLGSLT